MPDKNINKELSMEELKAVTGSGIELTDDVTEVDRGNSSKRKFETAPWQPFVMETSADFSFDPSKAASAKNE